MSEMSQKPKCSHRADDVRFAPDSDRTADIAEGPRSAISRSRLNRPYGVLDRFPSPALRKPSTKWACFSRLNQGRRVRTWKSKFVGDMARAWSRAISASPVRLSWPSTSNFKIKTIGSSNSDKLPADGYRRSLKQMIVFSRTYHFRRNRCDE
jgi:hypothetical protein